MELTKLPEEVVTLLNERIGDEFKAYYFYRAASNWCKNVGFMKAAEFFAAESVSEQEHAKGIEDYMVQWNNTPELPTIEKPKLTFGSLTEILKKAYELELALYEEYETTSLKIFKIGDVCTFDFLQKYRSIQTESLAEYSDKLNMLEGVEDNKLNLLLLEKKLF